MSTLLSDPTDILSFHDHFMFLTIYCILIFRMHWREKNISGNFPSNALSIGSSLRDPPGNMWQSVRSSLENKSSGRRDNDDSDDEKAHSAIDRRNRTYHDNNHNNDNNNNNSDNNNNNNNNNDNNNSINNNDDYNDSINDNVDDNDGTGNRNSNSRCNYNGKYREEDAYDDYNDYNQSFDIRLSKALTSIDKGRETIHTTTGSSYQMTSSSESQSILNRLVLAPRILPLRSKEDNIDYSTEIFNDDENDSKNGRLIVRTSDSNTSASGPGSPDNLSNTPQVKFWVPIGSDSGVIVEFCYVDDTAGDNFRVIDGPESVTNNKNNGNFDDGNCYRDHSHESHTGNQKNQIKNLRSELSPSVEGRPHHIISNKRHKPATRNNLTKIVPSHLGITEYEKMKAISGWMDSINHCLSTIEEREVRELAIKSCEREKDSCTIQREALLKCFQALCTEGNFDCKNDLVIKRIDKQCTAVLNIIQSLALTVTLISPPAIIPLPPYQVSGVSLTLLYEGSKSVTPSKVLWGQFGTQRGTRLFTPGTPGEKGDGLLLFEKSISFVSDPFTTLTTPAAVSAPLSSSSSVSSSFSSSAYVSPLKLKRDDISPPSAKDKYIAGDDIGVPIIFEWKGVKGSCILHLNTAPHIPGNFAVWGIQQPGSNATENNDNGREMVTVMLRALAKSVYDLHRGERKRRLLVTQKEIIRKQT